nr:hypothetical protein [Salinivirgaceae bacterium]
MNFYKILSIFNFVVLIATSCVQEMEVDEIPVEPALVVNSIIMPDSAFTCRVSQVVPITATSFPPVT